MSMEHRTTSNLKDKPASSFLDVAKLLALVTSVLALFASLTGAYYHIGQLEAFHLPGSYFPVQLQDTPRLIHQALFTITFKYVLKSMDSYALLAIAASLGLYAGALCLLQLTKSTIRSKAKSVKTWLGKPLPFSALIAVLTGASLYLLPRILVLVVSLGLAAPLTGYYAGRRDAEDAPKIEICRCRALY